MHRSKSMKLKSKALQVTATVKKKKRAAEFPGDEVITEDKAINEVIVDNKMEHKDRIKIVMKAFTFTANAAGGAKKEAEEGEEEEKEPEITMEESINQTLKMINFRAENEKKKSITEPKSKNDPHRSMLNFSGGKKAQAEESMPNNLKGISTLMRVKKEWIPPNWDEIMDQMKKDGKDGKSIDSDLSKISNASLEQKETGKYLMPSDISWCRGRTKFTEKELIQWFRRFRKYCTPKGKINPEGIAQMFKLGFPLFEVEDVIPIITQAYQVKGVKNVNSLDFKDCVKFLDAVTCKNLREKWTWAMGMLAPGGKQKPIHNRHIPLLVQLMDLVENNGFVNEPTEDEMDELLFNRPQGFLSPVEDRVETIHKLIGFDSEIVSDLLISYDDIVKLSESVVYARQ